MNELILKHAELPATIEKLNQFIIIGKERLNAQKAKIRAIEKTGMAIEAKEAALADTQDMADILLDAEMKLGGILEAIPNKKASSGEGTRSLPDDITKKQSHQAQTISRNPSIVERVKAEAREAGIIPTADHVYKLIKTEEAHAKVELIRNNHVATPDGKYAVLVIDPPWPMEKIERNCRPNQHGFDYPTMTEDELSRLSVPAADDCHLFLWTTHKFLPMSLRLIDTWGFRYVCTFVWHKPGGFQPVGLPQYNCEFVVYARKGSPKFTDTKAFNVCFEAPRGAHSEKPSEFYETLSRVTGGLRLDMFGRRKIDNFEAWGNQV